MAAGLTARRSAGQHILNVELFNIIYYAESYIIALYNLPVIKSDC